MHLYHYGDTRKVSESPGKSNQKTIYWTYIIN